MKRAYFTWQMHTKEISTIIFSRSFFFAVYLDTVGILQNYFNGCETEDRRTVIVLQFHVAGLNTNKAVQG